MSQAFIETDQPLALTSLLAEISDRCARSPLDQLENVIDQCQHVLCDLLGLDHSELWQAYEHSENSLFLSHLHHDSERAPQYSAAARWSSQSPLGIQGSEVPLRTDAKAFFPWILGQARANRTLVLGSLNDLPLDAVQDREMLVQEGFRSLVVVPLTSGNRWLGLMACGMTSELRSWTDLEAKVLRLAADVFAQNLARLRSERILRETQEKLQASALEIRQLKNRLHAESEYLELKLTQSHPDVVGQSRGIRKVLQQVEQVAAVNCPVLITGESGTGKELIAQSIHRLSRRANRTLVVVNCAALPAGLVESELFGRERGAFTGAMNSQAGRFELADGSTIFLDEIAELSLELQGKLLRVLQEGEYARLGNPRTRKADVRVIAATNRDLQVEVRKKNFREDLYYRLSVFPINLPPLRERLEDIPLLVAAFLHELSERMGKRISKVPRRIMESLEQHYWPGNIRELRNVIERGVILSHGDTLRITLSTPSVSARPAVTLAEMERQHILSTLEKTDWHIKGPYGAAKVLALKPGTLYSRMRKLGVPYRRQKDHASELLFNHPNQHYD